MQIDPVIYRKAFERYIRAGVTIETQLKNALEISGEVLLRKALDAPHMGRAIVTHRIQQLQEQFNKAVLSFSDKLLPDTTELETSFEQQHRELLKAFAQKPENILSADWQQKLEDQENFISSRLRQQIDPVIQPHYGVHYFT